ncbi:MAG: sphingosine kinase [Pirellula sp.]|nr:sphingosine kinase [Pirellula sp.]
MASSIIVLVNAKSGLDDKRNCREQLEELFALENVSAEVRVFQRGEELLGEARRAIAEGCRVLVAAGGDGTVSGVAAVVAGTETALGVLPMGTLNHFAKDLGIPLTAKDAVRNLVDGRIVQVDVGEVNGRTFVNNSSVGLYPSLVREREHEQRLGKRKWSAFVVAMWTVLGRYPLIHVTLEADELRTTRRTPLVFIGNNPYEIRGLKLGTRARLDGGKLSVYLTRDVSRWRLFVFALRALIGNLREAEDFDTIETSALSLRLSGRHVHVAADGEVVLLESPLEYRIRPAALNVIVPQPLEDAVTNPPLTPHP